MTKRLLAGLVLASALPLAWAQATPVGLWRTIDDDGKTEKSLVRITEQGGVLSGKVEKITDPAKQAELCSECRDDRKGKPMLGLEIIRGVRQNTDDKALWDGGEITDPNNGKSYRVRLQPQEGGKQLQVRGYIGPFYRNQTWLRVE
ncbi:MAG: DUF2147 domain-containing protein [Burkholderiales bacterium]